MNQFFFNFIQTILDMVPYVLLILTGSLIGLLGRWMLNRVLGYFQKNLF